jgi:hypothetical protein
MKTSRESRERRSARHGAMGREAGLQVLIDARERALSSYGRKA